MKNVRLLEVARMRGLISRLIREYGEARAMEIIREALEAEIRV